MATYVIEGKEIVAPDDMPLNKVLKIYNGMNSSNAGSSGFNPAKRESSGSFFGDIDPDTLQHDKDWLDASRIIWNKTRGGRPFTGSNKDLAEFGLDQMGWFNYNLPMMAMDAAAIQSATMDEKKAFLYLMNTYDDLQMSWGGFGRFIKGAATDPTNYVGLATLGIGTATSQATKVASKAALKSALKAATVTGLEGAVQGAVDSSARQSVEMAVDPTQEFSYGRLAGGTALGFGAGALLGGAIDVGATALRKGVPEGAVGKVADEVAPTPKAEYVEPTQLDMGFPEARGPQTPEAVQMRLDRLGEEGRLGMPETATQTNMFGDLPEQLPPVPPSELPPRPPVSRIDGQPLVEQIPPAVSRQDVDPDLVSRTQRLEAEVEKMRGIAAKADERVEKLYEVLPDASGIIARIETLQNKIDALPERSGSRRKKLQKQIDALNNDPVMVANREFKQAVDDAEAARLKLNNLQIDRARLGPDVNVTDQTATAQSRAAGPQPAPLEKEAPQAKPKSKKGKPEPEPVQLELTLPERASGNGFGSGFEFQDDLFDGLGNPIKVAEKPVQSSANTGGTTGGTSQKFDGRPSIERLKEVIDHVKNIARSHDGDGAGAILKAIRDVIDPEGWKLNIGSRGDIAHHVREAIDLLKRLDIRDMNEAYHVFQASGLSDTQRIGLQSAINSAAGEAAKIMRDIGIERIAAKDAPTKAYWDRLMRDFEPVQDLLARLYLGSSSSYGQGLSQSVGNPLAGRNRPFASVPEILRNSGIDPEKATPREREAAIAEFVSRHREFKEQFRDNARVKELELQIDKLKVDGDITKANLLLAEREALIESLAEREAVNQGYSKELWRDFNKKANEYVISTVFTPSTALINAFPSTIKTVYKPALNYLADPNSSARSLLYVYSGMWQHIPQALKWAKMAFTYGDAQLTKDYDKFLENSPAFKGQFGQILRIFPRLLQAADEFFFALNYRGFVIAEATADSITRATELGIKKGSPEFEAFVKEGVEKAIKDAYSPSGDSVQVLSYLRQKGIERGYTGDRLVHWMKTELEKNEGSFVSATNIKGKDYSNDMLFRREFSGEGWESRAAKTYEHLMNENALARIGFQLFIRTPIRVFEEGIRLTPGLNLIAPRFLDDLRGNNGTVRQVRAHGEALMSMAFGGAILSLYSQGMITGAGSYDYKQQRDRENSGNWKPYTIYFPNGSTLSYRNLDPFATPLKIIVNSLEQFQMYQYRKAQGEYDIDPSKELVAKLAMALMPTLQAVKDSGLTEGLTQIGDLITDLSDLENKGDAIKKFLGQKLQLAVPNVIGKTQTLFEDATPMKEPYTISQIIEHRISPFDTNVPAQRDAFGFKREVTNPIASYFGIGVNNLMDRKNVPEKAKEALAKLASLDAQVDVNFALSPKASAYFGDIDLREKYTKGGITWKDRIDDIYNSMKPWEAVYGLLNSKAPVGRPSDKGVLVAETKKILNEYRQAAIIRFLSEDPNAMALYRMTLRNNAYGQAGRFDVGLPP